MKFLMSLFISSLFLFGGNNVNTSFGKFNDILKNLLQGSLGKFLTLFIFSIAFLTYMLLGNKGIGDGMFRVFFIGSVGTLIIGGAVGIAYTFFDLGQTTFSDPI